MSLSASSSAASRRRAIPLTLAVVLIVVVAGAAVAGAATYYALNPPRAAGGGAHSVTVVDDLGRTVVAPVNPTRIVVLAPSVMDIVYRLGLRSDVVGYGCVPSEAGGILNEYSVNQTIRWNLTNSGCIADFPSLDTEGVANLSAQLVLASTITSAQDVNTLTETYGIPVVVLAPNTLEGIIGDVRIVEQIFPESTAVANALTADLAQTLQNASAFVQNVTGYSSGSGVPLPSVLLTYYFDSGGYYSYSQGTFGDSLITFMGGRNLASGIAVPYGEVNATYVLDTQPNFVIYPTAWNDPYLVSGETPSAWATAPYWSQLNATKVGVDVTLLSEPDPSMILALPYLESLLYPT
jgi:iron complex transport system substrate-binding protein